MDDSRMEGTGLVGDDTARAAVADELPSGPIDFAIPYIRRKPFMSFDIEYWALVFSSGSLYALEQGRKETRTQAGVAIDDSIDDIIDVARGRMIKRANKRAIESGLQDILKLAHETHLLTREQMAGLKTRRGLFRFRIMLPPLGERKKLSVVAWNKYRKGFQENLAAILGSGATD